MALTEEARLRLTIEAQNRTAKGVAEIQRSLEGLGRTVKQVATAFVSWRAMRDVIETTQKWGQETRTLSNTLGISADEASHFNAVARVLGISTDSLAGGFTSLGRQVLTTATASDATQTALGRLGVRVKDEQGNILGLSDVLTNVRTRLNEIPDGYLKASIAQEMFGSGARELHGLLAMSDEQWAQLAARTRNFARVFGGEGVAAIERMQQSQRSLTLGLTGLKLAIGVPLLEALDGAINRLADMAFNIMPALSAAVRSVTNVLGVLWGFVSTVTQTIATLAMRLASVTGLLRLFQGLVKGAVEVLRNFLGMLKAVTDRLESFRRLVDQNGITGALRKMAEDLPKPIQDLVKAVAAGGESVKKAIDGDWAGAGEKMKESGTSLSDAITGMREAFQNLPVDQQIQVAVAGIISGGMALRAAIAGWGIATAVVGLFARVGILIAAAVGGWPVLLVAALAGLLILIVNKHEEIRAWLSENLGKLGEWIQKMWPEWQQKLGGLWDNVRGAVQRAFEGIGNWLGENVPKFAEWLKKSIPEWIENAGKLFRQLSDWIIDVGIPEVVKWLGENVPKFGQWLTDSIPVWLENLGKLLGGVVTWVIDTLIPTLIRVFFTDVMPTLWKWITEGLPMVVVELAKFLAGLVLWIGKDLIPGIVSGMVRLGGQVVLGILRGLANLGQQLAKAIGDAFSKLDVQIGIFRITSSGITVNWPAIQLPNFTGAPGSGGGGGGFPGGGPTPRLMADGGIVTRPTLAVIGEAGPEAVIPLSRGRGVGTVIHVHNHIAGSVVSEHELRRTILQTLAGDLRLTRQTV